MIRSRGLLLMYGFIAGGCFGRLSEDAPVLDGNVGGAGASSDGSGGAPPRPRRLEGPGPKSEEGAPPAVPLATGGSLETGAAAGTGGDPGTGGGGLPMAPAIPNTPGFVEPRCGDDCCPAALTAVTPTIDGSSPDADIESPYLSGNSGLILFTSSANNLDGVSSDSIPHVFVYNLATGSTRRVSVGSGGILANGASAGNEISASGRHALFTSSADNLSPNDTNGTSDVFVFDQLLGRTLLVSRSITGESANGRSVARDISADGRFVVYSSVASDITAGDTNQAWDDFLADLELGTTRRISMGPGDQQSNVFSGNHAHLTPDGRAVSFHSQSDSLDPGDDNGAFDIFLHDVASGATTRVSQGGSLGQPNGNTFVLGMSDDARFFAGYSQASNLVPGDRNGLADVFVHDRLTGEVQRINVGPDGQEANGQSVTTTLSANGRFVAYTSAASNLIQPDVDGTLDGFLYDTVTRRTKRVSQTDLGIPGDDDSDLPRLSHNGSCYVFASRASNLPTEGSGTGFFRLLVKRHW